MPEDFHPADPARRLTDLAYDLLNVATAIRSRAQQTRRRVHRVDTLSRDHIGSDLEQIEFHIERLVALIAPLHDGTHAESPLSTDATPDEVAGETVPAPGAPPPLGRRGQRA
jgi:hypothetical protein